MDILLYVPLQPKSQLVIMYYERIIDKHLKEWAVRPSHKPILLRGARQVGKSTAIRNLGKSFGNYVEINFEKQPEYKALFKDNLDVRQIVPRLAAMSGKQITPKYTLLFLDEVQACPEAIMSLRFFKEDMPELHVIAAGSLLEFALEELPTFGVGRIHSMFVYPMTFDEFLNANGEILLLEARNEASIQSPLPKALHEKLISLLRIYTLIGGMPEVVGKWVESQDFIQCQEVQDDIIISYEDDFAKYKKKTDPMLLRHTLRSAAIQAGGKFVYSKVGGGYKSEDVKKALELLILSGILTTATHTSANGVPLGMEADNSYRKILPFDSGLLLRLLNMTTGDISQITTHILTSSAADLVNKGSIMEVIAGLEMQRYQSPNLRHDLFYWQRQSKNSQAEIDYLTIHNQTVVPIEVKAGMKGGMKSLWLFMREKELTNAIRCSLENYGEFTFTDTECSNAQRNVKICPLYAISRLSAILECIADK